MPPCPVARSTSSRIRFLSSALNLRRCALAGTSGSGELVAKGTAILDSVTMILLAALLCNYGRGFCLIDVGTEGFLGLRQHLRLPSYDSLTRSTSSARTATPARGSSRKGKMLNDMVRRDRSSSECHFEVSSSTTGMMIA